MSCRRRPLAFAPALALVALALGPGEPPRASACAALGRSGPISIVGEEALIVWDPAARREHFVRTADFAGADPDFGFLVPTPSRPELAEEPDSLFARLFSVYRAPEPQRPVARSRGGATRALGDVQAPPVRVLERRTVAGLDAAVLAADDAGALERWLAAHGYPSGPELARWLAPYVAQRWIVTAFRIQPGAQRASFSTSAVRMSFETDRPFFPYSEPQHAGRSGRGRPFRVSVVAPYRVRALHGERPWSARVGYADRPGAELADALGGRLARSVSRQTWLTVFDEPRSVRGTQDLFFEREPTPSVVRSTLRSPIRSPGPR